MRVWAKCKASLAGLVIASGLVLAPALARAAAITQGYQAKTTLPTGSVVSLTAAGGQQVEATTTDNDSLSAGVVVNGADALLDVQPQGSQVRVAVSGDVTILVSTVNGDIKTGDKLIATPLAGVAGLDYPPAPGVKYIAVANSDFTSTTTGAKKTSVKLTDGSSKDVYVGSIKARMLLGNRAPGAGEKSNFLTSLAQQISGKKVSLIRVVGALAILVAALVITGMVLYGSIKGTFVSLGRNPLSRDSVFTGLMRIVIIAMLVLSAGVVFGYLILVI